MEKRTVIICSIVLISQFSFAQVRQQDRKNPDIQRTVCSDSRTEIVLPQIDGFKVIKTDLHCHTNYSDGVCTPEYRIREAWRDGLDAIAITDHIEYRPADTQMASYLGVECPQVTDLNHSVNLAWQAAIGYGITVIPGIEITRSPVWVGHFNALFTTDNNDIPDVDPIVAMKNAKAQNAIVQNNHPGWAREDAELTQTTRDAIADGLIDGMECINDKEFYPRSIRDALENNLYVCAGTDIHATTYDIYLKYGAFRNMTLVLAKDASLESIREGLLAKRTLSYGYGDICADKELLEKFFLASFEFKTIRTDDKGNKTVSIINKTSLPYLIGMDNQSVDLEIKAFCSILVTVPSGSDLVLTVSNMWYGPDAHPVITISRDSIL